MQYNLTIEEQMMVLGLRRSDLEDCKQIVRTLYKNPKGEPFEMTDGQSILFASIYMRLHPRMGFLTYTQYGKSDIVSMAILTRITTFAERWLLIGGSADKAKIIMNKLIDHIFDNEYTKSKLTMKNISNIERLRHERSRSRITFHAEEGRVGEISVLSGDSSKKGESAGDILVGHGAANVVTDDAHLLSDIINAKVVRMLGGHSDNFFLKIGNAFGNHHFKKSLSSDRFKTIIIDSKQGVKEGRQPQEFFDEMREEMNNPILFDAFYNCIFPPEDSAMGGVWMPVFLHDDISRAMEEPVDASGEVQKNLHFGSLKYGVDVADTGVDHDVIIKRSAGYAEVLYDNEKSDQMKLTGLVSNYHSQNEGKIYVDRIGVGSGVTSRMREMRLPHTGVGFGEKSSQNLYANKKAELVWNAKKWINTGGKLSKDQRWYQLCDIMYMVSDTNGKIQIMPKKVALNMGIKSPDVADAFFVTFQDRDVYKNNEDKELDFFHKKMLQKKKKNSSSGYNVKMI